MSHSAAEFSENFLESVKALKEEGNALFKEAKYGDASDKYTLAIALLLRNNPTAHSKETSAILSNRSACSLSANKLSEAEQDAKNSISMDPSNIKAHYRLSKSLALQNNYSGALKAIEAGLLIDSENKSILALKLECEKKYKSDRKLAFLNSSSRYCCDDKQNATICLEKIAFCGSCGETVNSSLESSPLSPIIKLSVGILKETIKSVISNDKAFLMNIERIKTHGMDVTFRGLFDKNQFKSLIYPGFPDYVVAKMPSSLKDILSWRELKIDILETATRAVGVLENVKKKGADNGSSMDAATESFLLRQISNEQLARDIIQAVRRYSRSLSAVHASLTLKVASGDCEMAHRDQLDTAEFGSLLRRQVMVQENFMGDEWSLLISEDIVRFTQDEKMTSIDESNMRGYFSSTSLSSIPTASPDTRTSASGVSMSFLEQDMLADKYPALFELIGQLHALPFEVNKKSDSSLQLLEPSKGCTLLLRFSAGSGQHMRWDNREMSENNQFINFNDPQSASIDSLIRLSCSYHIVPTAIESTASASISSAGPLYIHDATDDSQTNTNKIAATAISNSIANDQLVLHCSTKIQNGRTATPLEYFAIVYYIHGRSWG